MVSLALVLALVAVAPSAAEQRHAERGTCRSVGGLKFDPTQRSMQRSQGLEVCSQYRGNTCCNDTHSMPLRLKIREPVVAKFNGRCQKITEEMVCSACHPFVGTNKMKTVCPRLCNDWYSACRNEYYSYGSTSLTPCYGNALVCSRLSAIASDGAEFCSKMGFQVGNDDDNEGYDCFDGSVPRQLGEAEPSEPWQEVLKRMFEEQSKNPTGEFILLLFSPLVLLFLTYRLFKKSRSGSYEVGSNRRELTLEQVRLLQQARYAANGYDSDSSSPPMDDEDFDDLDGHEKDEQKEPHQNGEAVASESQPEAVEANKKTD